jgi:AraC-like DNA-binding protein
MKDSYPKMYLYRRIVQAKLFIDAHYAEKIDVANISGEAAFSKFHFIRLFRQAYGLTPNRYLVFVRIEKAKELLALDTPVGEVCVTVGFESHGTFSTLFKRMTGKTPAAFREEQLQRKQRLKKEPLVYIPGCFASMKGFK